MKIKSVVLLFAFCLATTANADENLFGYVRGAEPLPDGSWELYQVTTQRNDKDQGKYAYHSWTNFDLCLLSSCSAKFMNDKSL